MTLIDLIWVFQSSQYISTKSCKSCGNFPLEQAKHSRSLKRRSSWSKSSLIHSSSIFKSNGPQFCPCLWPWHLKNFAELISKVILWQQLFTTASKDWVKMRSWVLMCQSIVDIQEGFAMYTSIYVLAFLSVWRKKYNVTSIYATIYKRFEKNITPSFRVFGLLRIFLLHSLFLRCFESRIC